MKPIIYQVFTRLFGADSLEPAPNGDKHQNGCGTMADFSVKALGAIRSLGATHIWYTGIIEHATTTNFSTFGIIPDHPGVVKGLAGSPYAIKDYYDVDPDLSTKVDERRKEFLNLVRRTHRAGLKVVIDFVPNHVARQYHSDCCPEGTEDLGVGDRTDWHFYADNNFYYCPGQQFAPQFPLDDVKIGAYIENPARATGNDCFSPNPSRDDWYETVKLNYGIDYTGGHVCHFNPVPTTWKKMVQILLYWAATGIDAFRCDMAEMVPCEFWHWAIPQVKASYPRIEFIAEVYDPQQYRHYIHHGHFDYLYDKVGLYDTLRGVIGGQSASCITSAWQAVDDINEHMLQFLENHDEQRIASDFFCGSAIKGRPALLVSALMRKSPFMVYFGQELGERGMDAEGFSGRDGRTTIFDYWTINSIRRWRNGGKFGKDLLTKEEVELQTYYTKVLNLCNSERALSEGSFYDIMYANYDNPLMDTNRQYAFLRYTDGELLLIIANFSDDDTLSSVLIPTHAFEHLGLPKEMTTTCAKDLLSGSTFTIPFAPYTNIPLKLPAQSGVIIKIKI